MSQTDQYRFQVNLGGMIDILANHLYSSPRVFIREVLQNATDAITARKELRKVVAESKVLKEDKALGDTASESNDYEGKVIVELSGSGEHQVLMIQDNGIGLSEEDIHRFCRLSVSLPRREPICWLLRLRLSDALGLGYYPALW